MTTTSTITLPNDNITQSTDTVDANCSKQKNIKSRCVLTIKCIQQYWKIFIFCKNKSYACNL